MLALCSMLLPPIMLIIILCWHNRLKPKDSKLQARTIFSAGGAYVDFRAGAK